MLKYTNPGEAVKLLSQVKALLVDGQTSAELDTLITEAGTESAAAHLSNVHSIFNQRCYQKMRDCDWTQLSDAGLTSEKKAEWDSYRTSLKSSVLPSSMEELENYTWPAKPE